jgi:dTMP kinase
MKNRLDRENFKFKLKVKEGYNQLVKLYPNRIKVIDANLGIEEVQQLTKNIIVEAINKWKLQK